MVAAEEESERADDRRDPERVSSCDHAWKKVAPVVVVASDPLAAVKGGETYNAVCPSLRCSGLASLAYVNRDLGLFLDFSGALARGA